MAWERAITTDGAHESYWLNQARFADTVVTVQPVNNLSCWKLSIEWVRTSPASTRDDILSCHMHIAKIVGGGLYSIGLDSEIPTLEGFVNTFLASVAALQHDQISRAFLRWHQERADLERQGPALRTTAIAGAGGVPLMRMPDQNAVTITMRTASRKHWGRIYLPGLSRSQYDMTYGRPSNGLCDSLATYFRTLYTGLDGAGYALGVWSPGHKAFLTIDEIHVDNVPDIIRSRRPKQASYRKTFVS